MRLKYVLGSFVLLSIATLSFVLNTPTSMLVVPTQIPARNTSPKSATSTPIGVAAQHTQQSEPQKTVSPPKQKDVPTPMPPPRKSSSPVNPSPEIAPHSAPIPPPVLTPQPMPPEPPPNSNSTPPTPVTMPPTSDFATEVELAIHLLVNNEREAAGIPVLSYSTDLSLIARAHSVDMLAKNYFSHQDPQGCDMTCRIKNANYSYWAIGENIYTMHGYSLSAQATAEKVLAGWMQSPGHRANILNDKFTTEGVGVAAEDSRVYATENFAKPR